MCCAECEQQVRARRRLRVADHRRRPRGDLFFTRSAVTGAKKRERGGDGRRSGTGGEEEEEGRGQRRAQRRSERMEQQPASARTRILLVGVVCLVWIIGGICATGLCRAFRLNEIANLKREVFLLRNLINQSGRVFFHLSIAF